MKYLRVVFALGLVFQPAASPAQAPALSPAEQQLRTWIDRHKDDQVAYLARAVDIPSGTMNLAGVRRMGQFFRATLDSLGFTTRWIPMDSAGRSGHLFAEHKGRPDSPTILLIGHLDTVFEGDGTQWVRNGTDSIARGSGSNDMKGGDVVIIYALKALAASGGLKDANIIVAFTGDEEKTGAPLSIARRDLLEAGRRADVALAFESGDQGTATIARRGASAWQLEITARQAHSSGVFGQSAGYGAIYEAARILNEFRIRLAGVPNLTFNPGLIAGGTEVTVDADHVNATASGKTNIIAPRTFVRGDLRFITQTQLDSARNIMRQIVAQGLPGARATITFEDAYPAMSPTDANLQLLSIYSGVSEALGQGRVEPFDPSRRGAGDVSFVAPHVPAALDGLGASGNGAHSPEETVNLNTLPRQTARAAIFIYRLTTRKPIVRKKDQA